MKKLFESKYLCTRAVYSTIYKQLYGSKKVYSALKIFYSIICVVANIATLTRYSRLHMPSLLALFVLYGAIYYFYQSAAKKQYKNDLDYNNQNEVIALFTAYQDYFTAQKLDTRGKVYYKDIKKVIKSRQFVILVTAENAAYAFKKDSFTKGTPEKFEEFLKEKGFKFSIQ